MPEPTQAFQEKFTSQAIYHLDESTRMVKIALAQLTEEEMWQKPNESLNSVANLLLHLCGNMTQYIIASLGEQPDLRERDLEFSTEEGYTKAELLDKLVRVVEAAKVTIRAASAEAWIKNRMVQGFDFSGIGTVFHAVEHYSYHTGQIALITKLLKNRDLGFYDGLDLNTTNEQL